MKFGRRLLGLLAAATQAVPLRLLHMRPLQQWFARHRVSPLEDSRRLLPSGPDCQAAVAWWLMTPGLQGGVPMGPVCSRVIIATDASMRGWGTVCQGCSAQGLWRPSWRGFHVNLLELEAVRRALMYFLLVSRGKPVLIRTDNSAVVSYINRQGGMHSRALHNGARRLLLWAQARGVSLRAVYLPGKDNVAADLMSRGRPPPRGMTAPPGHRAGHLGPFRPGSGGPLCLPGDYSLPLGVFHDRPQGHIGGGCPSVHIAPGPSVHFSPLPSSASGAGQSEDVAGQGANPVAPDWPHQLLDGRASDNAGGDPLASPGQAGHALAGTGPCCGIRTLGFTGCMFGPWAGAIQRSRCISYQDSADGQSPLYQGALRWSLEQVFWLVPFQE